MPTDRERTIAQRLASSHPMTLARQSGQGLTFGFMDELQDILGAGLATGAGYVHPEAYKPFTENLSRARQRSQDQLSEDWEERPITSLGGQITGAAPFLVATGGAQAAKGARLLPQATAKAALLGQRLSNYLNTGNRLTNAGRMALVSGGSGALSGLGSSGDDIRARLTGMGTGAALGAGIGSLVGGVMPPANPTRIAERLSEGIVKNNRAEQEFVKDIALRGNPEDTLRIAQERIASANRVGVPLTLPEAIAKTEADDILARQAVIAGTPQYQNIMAQRLGNFETPSQVQSAIANVAGRLSGGGSFDDLANRLRESSGGAYGRMTSQLTEAAKPYYDELAQTPFNPESARLQSVRDAAGRIGQPAIDLLQEKTPVLGHLDAPPNMNDEFSGMVPDLIPEERSGNLDIAQLDRVRQFLQQSRAPSGQGSSRLPMYPVLNEIRKAGGIDPNGFAAKELASMGITNREYPALFRTGGRNNLDTLADESPILKDMLNSSSERNLYGAIRSELLSPKQTYRLHPEQQALRDAADELDRLGIDPITDTNEQIQRRLYGGYSAESPIAPDISPEQYIPEDPSKTAAYWERVQRQLREDANKIDISGGGLNPSQRHETRALADMLEKDLSQIDAFNKAREVYTSQPELLAARESVIRAMEAPKENNRAVLNALYGTNTPERARLIAGGLGEDDAKAAAALQLQNLLGNMRESGSMPNLTNFQKEVLQSYAGGNQSVEDLARTMENINRNRRMMFGSPTQQRQAAESAISNAGNVALDVATGDKMSLARRALSAVRGISKEEQERAFREELLKLYTDPQRGLNLIQDVVSSNGQVPASIMSRTVPALTSVGTAPFAANMVAPVSSTAANVAVSSTQKPWEKQYGVQNTPINQPKPWERNYRGGGQ